MLIGILRCEECGEEQGVILPDRDMYVSSKKCFACGGDMLLTEEFRDIEDEGCDGEIPYGPIEFLDL